MPEFLKKAACRGRQPLQLAARRQISRPDLIARLLRERRVARFIVAPDGFGKTGLALEYADTVFSFEHVFWIDGKSPCFLRDLDRGAIAATLLEEDRQPFLAVIEDVPPLDQERVELLSDELDRLLDRTCEVLVTCTPSCDAFARHRDRVKLAASDLLLSDEEVDAFRTPAERSAEPAAVLPSARRVAGLVWEEGDRASFLASALHEELPSDMLLPMFVMLALGKGSLEDVAAFGPFGNDQEILLADQYAYLGIDRQAGSFETAPFGVDDIVSAFARKAGMLADRSLFPDAGTLVKRLGDALVARSACVRACDFVRTFAPRPARAAWLAEHGRELLDAVCLLAARDVHRSLAGETAGEGAVLNADESVRCALLGDRKAACTAARKAARESAAPPSVRMTGVLVLSHCASAEGRQRADTLAAALLKASGAAFDAAHVEDWKVSASVRSLLRKGSIGDAARTWLEWHDRGARGRFVNHAAADILRFASAGRSRLRDGEDGGASVSADIDRLGALVRKDVSRRAREGALGLADALVGIAYEHACEQGVLSIPSLDAKVALAVRRIEMKLYAQRTEGERREQERAERERTYAATHPDTYRGEHRPKDVVPRASAAPLLTINLFGGLDVLMGEDRVDPASFRRQKVKTLLALLVLNGGREFSRDKLVSLLWPESELEAARKNFYGIWAMLRRALSTPSGTCPYLIRQQQGLRLDPTLFASDVTQLEDVCRILLFERPGYGGWANVFSLVNDRFSDDLLPSENDNEAIAALRVDYRNKLVDALVAASQRLVAADEVREGLWFARAALQRDRSREDAYTTLMKAQLASGQRTAALETYFSCRRFLADELGIDPSLETMRLYRSIIETEEELE